MKWCMVLLSVLAVTTFAGDALCQGVNPATAGCIDGQCYPNTGNYGYYQTRWRRWPTSVTVAQRGPNWPEHLLDGVPRVEVPDPRQEVRPFTPQPATDRPTSQPPPMGGDTGSSVPPDQRPAPIRSDLLPPTPPRDELLPEQSRRRPQDGAALRRNANADDWFFEDRLSFQTRALSGMHREFGDSDSPEEAAGLHSPGTSQLAPHRPSHNLNRIQFVSP